MIKVTDKGFWMHDYLKRNLDTIAYNSNHDYDFIIIISGSGMTRIGKSVLAQQVAYYLSYVLKKPFTLDNIVFGGAALMDAAKKFPKQSVFIDDESRDDISSKKQLETFNKDLMTFFNECGMLNHIIILVATDFFDFTKGIAINRSEMLLNVKRISEKHVTADGTEVMKFRRGIFDIYGRESKKKLYKIGKKDFDNYEATKRDTYGEFRDFWVVDRKAYEERKLKFIERDKNEEAVNDRVLACIQFLEKEGYSDVEIAKALHYTRERVNYLKNHVLKTKELVVFNYEKPSSLVT